MEKDIFREDFYEHYNLVGTIWEGLYSRICKAVSKESKDFFAVKIIKREHYELKKEGAEILKKTMEKFRELNHPNIAKVFDIYRDTENYYMIIEFVEGDTLLDYVKNFPKVTEKIVAGLMKELLSALAYAYKHSVIHGDIAFHKIIIIKKKGDPVLKLLDFAGSSELVEFAQPTMKNVIFFSPEKAMGKKYSECKNDVWSCGVVCSSLLSGKTLFGTKDSIKATLDEIASYEITMAKLKEGPWKKVSEEAKQFLCHMLEKDPEKRSSPDVLLYDKWMNCSNESELVVDDLKKLCQNADYLRNLTSLQNAVLYYISGKAKTSLIQSKVTKLLKELDKTGAGKVSKDQFVKVIQSVGAATKSEAETIFAAMDVTKDGMLSYTEIISGFFGKALAMRETNLKTTFETLDTDRSGDLDYNELVKALCTEESGSHLSESIEKELLPYRGKKIKYEEFVNLMQKIS